MKLTEKQKEHLLSLKKYLKKYLMIDPEAHIRFENEVKNREKELEELEIQVDKKWRELSSLKNEYEEKRNILTAIDLLLEEHKQ